MVPASCFPSLNQVGDNIDILELYVVNRWLKKFLLETALCSLTLSSVLYSITSNIYHFIQLSIIGKSVCTFDIREACR